MAKTAEEILKEGFVYPVYKQEWNALLKCMEAYAAQFQMPGSVSPQAAVVAEEKFFTTDEVWRMYSEDPAYGHKSYKEFAEENGWVMVKLSPAPASTEEQDKEVKEDNVNLSQEGSQC